MKKLILVLSLFLALPARSGEVDAYKRGFSDGVKAGMELQKQVTKEEVSDVWDLIDASLNYRKLLIGGEVPPPVVIDRTVVEKKGAVSQIKRELEFKPPAYFPVDRIVELRELLGGEKVVIPKGYVVLLKTESVPLSKVALYFYLARTLGFTPVYSKSKDVLVFASYDREADARHASKVLSDNGIPSEVVKSDEDIVLIVPKKSSSLSEEIKELSEKLLNREREIYGMKPVRKGGGLSGVIYYLQKAYYAVDTINAERYPDFDTFKLKEDINRMINEITKYLADKQPYRRVIVSSPGKEEEKVAVPSTVEEKIEKIYRVLEE